MSVLNFLSIDTQQVITLYLSNLKHPCYSHRTFFYFFQLFLNVCLHWGNPIEWDIRKFQLNSSNSNSTGWDRVVGNSTGWSRCNGNYTGYGWGNDNSTRWGRVKQPNKSREYGNGNAIKWDYEHKQPRRAYKVKWKLNMLRNGQLQLNTVGRDNSTSTWLRTMATHPF